MNFGILSSLKNRSEVNLDRSLTNFVRFLGHFVRVKSLLRVLCRSEEYARLREDTFVSLLLRNHCHEVARCGWVLTGLAKLKILR